MTTTQKLDANLTDRLVHEKACFDFKEINDRAEVEAKILRRRNIEDRISAKELGFSMEGLVGGVL
jgi:hypothetical protein